MTENWLIEMIKSNLDVEPTTPYDVWMTAFLRQNVQRAEARAAKGEAQPEPDDWLSRDPGVRAALKALSGESITLRQDAAAVLGGDEDNLPEDLAQILDHLERYVKRSGMVAGVIKALGQTQGDDLWGAVLKDQLAAIIEQIRNTLAAAEGEFARRFGQIESQTRSKHTVNPQEYRQWLERSHGSESKAQGGKSYAQEFGN
jgi:hypothetical protein